MTSRSGLGSSDMMQPGSTNFYISVIPISLIGRRITRRRIEAACTEAPYPAAVVLGGREVISGDIYILPEAPHASAAGHG